MKSSQGNFARGARRGTALGAAALIAGVALAPAASADDVATGTLAASLLQTITSASAAGSDESKQIQGPRVTVSQTVISEDGEHEITVKGTGFKDDSVVGARPPLAGKNPGIYVILGKFADEWKPSEDAASTARKSISQFWAVNAEDVETIGGAARGGMELRPDGSFTASFTVSKALVDAQAGDVAGNLGIYTYAGGGAVYAPWETYQPITFGEPASEPAGMLGSLTSMFPIL